MSPSWSLDIMIPLVFVYLLFLRWYGGRGKPLESDEVDAMLAPLEAQAMSAQSRAAMQEIRQLVANDDGREFVMQNLVRYRDKADYPAQTAAEHGWGDDPRAADRRYGKAILWPLLRYGNLILFVARRSGSFVELEGAPAWHYVAMVRYRSRRDFLRFALSIERADITQHKWAAIETTHIFPVSPVISLVAVRTLVAGLLLAIGACLHWAIG